MSEVKLHETMDAKVWTDEFLSLNPDAKDFGTMIGWFANAIMVGYDHAARKLQPKLDQAQAEIAKEVAGYKAQLAVCQKQLEDMTLAFKAHLETMSSINAHSGYTFTQPLINAHKALADIREAGGK